MSEENKDLPEGTQRNEEESLESAEITESEVETTTEAESEHLEGFVEEESTMPPTLSSEEETSIDKGTKKMILGFLGGVIFALIVGIVILSTSSRDILVKTNVGNVTKDDLYVAMIDKYDAEAVLQTLVYEKALSKNFPVSDKEVQVKIDEIKEQFGADFEETIQQYGYKSEEQLRADYRLNMMKQRAATAEIEITDEEIQEYYDEYRPEIEASHIIVDEEKTAKEVAKKLEEGGDFAELAKEYSTDASAEKGGELGFFSAQDMDEDFFNAAAELKVGEISSIVKTQYGYHIIKKTDEKEKRSLEEMREEIIESLQQSKVTEDIFNEALAAVLKAVEVKVVNKDFKSIFD